MEIYRDITVGPIFLVVVVCNVGPLLKTTLLAMLKTNKQARTTTKNLKIPMRAKHGVTFL
jgi:hypothetical protein